MEDSKVGKAFISRNALKMFNDIANNADDTVKNDFMKEVLKHSCPPAPYNICNQNYTSIRCEECWAKFIDNVVNIDKYQVIKDILAYANKQIDIYKNKGKVLKEPVLINCISDIFNCELESYGEIYSSDSSICRYPYLIEHENAKYYIETVSDVNTQNMIAVYEVVPEEVTEVVYIRR